MGFLAYHLPRQEPRGWRRTAVIVMLASTLPAAMIGNRVFDGQPAGVVLTALAGPILTGLLLVTGKRVYDGRRAIARERVDGGERGTGR